GAGGSQGGGSQRAKRRRSMASDGALPQGGGSTIKHPETAAAGGKPSRPCRPFLLRCLSLFGVVSLSYVLGAAVMFFELPSSSFLRRAFVGGVAWYETWRASPPDESRPPLTVGKIDRPAKTCDGFTLCMYGDNSQAVLVNM